MIDEQLALADDGNPHAADSLDTPRPRFASLYQAVMVVEGVEEADEETQIAAWQYLVDTGLVWKLQGAFGRQAARMIEDGIIEDHPRRRI